ncbi:3'-5' exonuclease [Austwickia chelonae]|uniref:3'-5' exonuclease n=1 Tax=Austwickia chelonae TaxID=100225 RepID=UPI000E26A35F|nr:3'-5' exonuclease [Austwickia chelonae]
MTPLAGLALTAGITYSALRRGRIGDTLRRARKVRTRRKTSPHRPSRPQSRTLPARSRVGSVCFPRVHRPFAEAGMRGEMFVYAHPDEGKTHTGPYAVIGIKTTGPSPSAGARIVEIAVVRIDNDGQITDEYTTLVNPGSSTGTAFAHGITDDTVAQAPTFAQIADDVLARLDGAVVVAHNALFEEAFLSMELTAAGFTRPRLPALCTAWLSRQVLDVPNHRLGTLSRQLAIPFTDSHTALGEARTLAALLPALKARFDRPLRYRCAPYRHRVLPRPGHAGDIATPRTAQAIPPAWTVHSPHASAPMADITG